MNVYVYDLEQFSNFHSGVFYNIKTKDIKTFIIHEEKDDREKYLHFLLHEVNGLIGFNNINYDYPLLHYLINNPNAKAEELYKESQKIINSEYSAIYENNVLIPQLDLMRLWHFNNKAKMTSLKKLQVAMKWPTVQDLPLPHYSAITPLMFNDIIKYNINDVLSTNNFYELSKNQINLRKVLGKKYNINILNKGDASIGEEILLSVMSKKLNLPKYALKQLKTYREEIKFSECILDYITFNSKEFNNLLNDLKATTIKETKNSLDKSVIYKGFKYDFGTGGIHGCIKPGVYEADDNYDILDIDVRSFYPRLAIVNKLFPEHLTNIFCEGYEELYDERPKYKKGTPENYGVKISLNGAYGKSNEEFSFLYDPKFTMQITINGQLLLCMLCEWIVDLIDDVTILQINTDGVTIKVKKSDKNIINNICLKWEKLTNLNLEYVNYSKMVIRDVNNYLAIDDKNKIKQKGCFEIDRDWHKDHSMLIVRKALTNYFVFNIPIIDTLKNGDTIDFCKSFSTTKGWKPELHTINSKIELQKTNRYLISNIVNNSGGFFKRHNDGRLFSIEANESVLILNNYDNKYHETNEFKKNINYNYYVNECYKIINVIENKQLTLF